MVVIGMLEGVEDGIELFDAAGELVGIVELIAACATAAFDSPVHLRRSWR